MDDEFEEAPRLPDGRKHLSWLLLIALFLTPILVVEIAHRAAHSPEINPAMADPTNAAVSNVLGRKGHARVLGLVTVGSGMLTACAAVALWSYSQRA
ncbi:hypothetical protein AB1L30_05360 [Bremerella sp. JC817]|uniref:hypothetical protein n=1 Tax=Bremerella sp. JC817 TaxID=3231756 RepID=UPI0034585999